MIFKGRCQRDFTCIKNNGHSGDCEFTKWPTSEELEKLTKQVGGNHYEQMAIQPWEVIQRGDLDFWEGNVIKYVMRYRAKNGLEDLKKARHYLDYLIEREQKNGSK
jgi:hypothetical protein